MMDHGKPWKANAETTSGIASMQLIVGKYQGRTLTPAQMAEMKTQLETEFQAIFDRCTMTGEAHNQLHNYLLPMKTMMDELDQGDAASMEHRMEELKNHLSNYKNYFE